MRLCSLSNAQENCVLAQPIRDSMGRVLLGSGIQLSSMYIERLKKLGFQAIYIEDDRLDDVEIVPAISDQTRDKAHKLVVKLLGSPSIDSKNAPTGDLQNLVKRMIDDILNCPNVPNILQSVRGFDEYTFHHSINTAIIALILGVSEGFSEQKLTELGTGALMHDIGKVRVPNEILNKPSTLTKDEFDQIKRHTNYGYETVKKLPDLSIISAHIAFQHHEKWDGSGYPRGLKQTEIHEYARITCIADVYDALTSPRSYRNAFQPYEAYEYVLAKSGTEFDPKIINTFKKHISVYPNGTGVRLSNNYKGAIIKQNPNFPARPWIRVLYDNNNQLNTPIDLNLIEHPSLLIVEIDNF